MEAFEAIYHRAAQRKGGEHRLESLIGDVPTVPRAVLDEQTDDRVLSMMTMRIFQAGFAWRVVEQKWAGFEAAFFGFDTTRCATMDDSDIETLAADTRIIRNRQKIITVPKNARFVESVSMEHGRFADWLAQWPDDDTIGLWSQMQQRGSRLGGMTCAVVLRSLGKDTFLLSSDLVTLLIANRVITKKPTAKRELAAVQAAFNQWRADSGRSLADISRIGAMSVGDNRVGADEDEAPPPFLLDADD